MAKKKKAKQSTPTKTQTPEAATISNLEGGGGGEDEERPPAYIPRTPVPSPTRGRGGGGNRRQRIKKGSNNSNTTTNDNDDNNVIITPTHTSTSNNDDNDHDSCKSPPISTPPRRQQHRIFINNQNDQNDEELQYQDNSNDDEEGMLPQTPTRTTTPARRESRRPVPPHPPSTPAAITTTTTTWKQRLGFERTMEEEADHLAQCLHNSAEQLLDTLFRYLSQLPVVVSSSVSDNDDDDDGAAEELISENRGGLHQSSSKSKSQQRLQQQQQQNQQFVGGMTLPASALGWLSSQLSCCNNNSNNNNNRNVRNNQEWNTMAQNRRIQDRLRLLTFLLPRVTHLRIVRDRQWPVLDVDDEEDDDDHDLLRHHHLQQQRQQIHQSFVDEQQQQQHPIPQVEVPLDTSHMSVVSGLTTDDHHHHRANTTTATTTTGPTRQAFLEYMNGLQHHPLIDLRLFVNLQCLVLEGIPPTWLIGAPNNTNNNSGSDKTSSSSLQVFSLTKAALSDGRELHHILQPSYGSLTHLKLQDCAIGTWSRLQNECRYWTKLQSLSLSHNQLTEIPHKGLRQLSCLQVLDLSYNCLQTMEYAHYSLGQLRVLKLSHNQIQTTTNGLNKLYSLEELYLDNNQLTELPLNLAYLPLLKRLDLQGNKKTFVVVSSKQQSNNPVKTYKRKKRSKQNRIQLLEAFQQVRRGLIKEELPVLNGIAPTGKEWKRIQSNSYATITTTTTTSASAMTMTTNNNGSTSPSLNNNMMTTTTTTTEIRKVKRKRKPQQAVIDGTFVGTTTTSTISSTLMFGRTVPGATKKIRSRSQKSAAVAAGTAPSIDTEKETDATSTKRAVTSSSPSSDIDIGFSLQDVIISLCPKPSEKSVMHHVKCDETPLANLPQFDEDPCFPAWPTESLPPPKSLPLTGKENVTNNQVSQIKDKPILNKQPIPEEKETLAGTETNAPEENLPSTASPEEASGTGAKSPERPPPLDREYIGSGDVVATDNQPDRTNDKSSTPKRKTFHTNDDIQSNGPSVLSHTDARKTAAAKGATLPVDSSNGGAASGKASSTKAASKPKVATIQLNFGATKKFDILDADWDELVQHAADGLIPNGKIQTPVAALEEQAPKGSGGVFSPDVVSLLPPPTSSAASLAAEDNNSISTPLADNNNINSNTASVTENDGSIPTELESTVGPNQYYGLSTALPENIYDDDSCISSIGTSDFPKLNKFQLAEDNASYDGPDACQNMNVLKNLELYFQTYVFPSSVPSTYEGEDDDEDEEEAWKLVSIRYPRIQLWPEDRRGLDASLFPGDPTTLQPPAWASNRERCVRVWEEDVIPCGKPAIRRLTPNRRSRLGFHGDQLFEKNGAPVPYAESRKVFLCLTTAAFYAVVREDAVTIRNGKQQRHQGINNKRKFPAPIENASAFEDAPWPHAVARHSYQDLQAISIGFEFQRLTLRFANPAWRRTDPYVYVLMTCNKNNTVSLLQEIQRLAKEANEHVQDLVSDSTAVAIENDSQMVFDALAVSVAPDLVGTVLHYQIVQQRWKHGESRGTVRRVVVVTDSKMLLLDEDYAADSHKIVRSMNSNSPTNGGRGGGGGGLADVSYRIVDEATLKQVDEVQAATTDPRAITILIQPLSRLSRIHRWRLVCRDSEGAERLVEDVRKAMALAKGGM